MQSGVVVTRDRAFASSQANVDVSLVGGLPVTSGWRLVGQGKVGLVVFDFLVFVGVITGYGLIGVLVYQGLEAS